MIYDSNQIQDLQQQQLEKLVKSLGDTLERDLNITRRDIAIEITRLSELTNQSAQNMKKQQITMLDEMQSRQNQLIQILEASTQKAVNSLRWSWLRATVPSLLVLAVILSASWALIELKTRQFINLKAEVIQSKQTLENLPRGVEYQQDSTGIQYFLVKKEPEVYKTKSGEWAIKLKK